MNRFWQVALADAAILVSLGISHIQRVSLSRAKWVLFSQYGSLKQSMELILAAGAEASQSMLKLGACFIGDPLLYQRATSLGAQDQKDVHNNNFLHHAAAENRTELLEDLIADTSRISSAIRDMLAAPNHIGQYPLDVAAAKKNYHAALQLAQLKALLAPRTSTEAP